MSDEQERYYGYSETIERYRDQVKQGSELFQILDEAHTELHQNISCLNHNDFNATHEFQNLSQFYLEYGEEIPASDTEFTSTLNRLDKHILNLEEYREKIVKSLVEKLIRVM
jgi:hypothetical protein